MYAEHRERSDGARSGQATLGTRLRSLPGKGNMRPIRRVAEIRGATMESFDALSNMLLDSEIIVRVEMASVTLSAREWSEIRAGDVIETSVHLKEPVVLRVEGREVARGELVNVDGRVGVRVSDMLEPR